LLLDAVTDDLPAAGPLAGISAALAEVAWWELGADDRYLWDHLVEHLREAGGHSDAEAVSGDLRWVDARLERFNPAAPAADLSMAGTPRSARMRVALDRAAHLLAPTEPTESVIDILHSRLAADPDWAPQVAALRNSCPWPRLVNRWPLPDLPEPALRRVLTGHNGPVTAVAFSPDGTLIATASTDGTARTWDTTTGQPRTTLTGHQNPVNGVAFSPDGTLIATASHDQTVRIWDTMTWQVRAMMRVDASISARAWLGDAGLVVGGDAGLYVFDFLPGAVSARSPSLGAPS
jgi:WD domain, G-beta repeat